MGKAKQVARFAIGSEAGICSEVWNAWASGADVYVTSSSMKGRMKISFHGSRICHYALLPDFFDKHRAKFNRQDRTSLRWRRPPTPELGPLVAAFFVFAAFESWEPFWEYKEDKPITLLPPPVHGWGTQVVVLFSSQDPDNHCGGALPYDVYITRLELTNGDYVTLVPGPVELPRDFFVEREMPKVTVISGFDTSLDDHRNVMYMEPALLGPDGPLRIMSLHNMRVRSMPAEQFERERAIKSRLWARLRVYGRKFWS